jgi:hypothetical protein
MNSLERFARSGMATLAGLSLVLVLGCGDDEFEKRYPVSGTVKYKGEPLSIGRINFIPAPENKTGRPAYGDIENGAYTLTTVANNDGAFPGAYNVTVDAREVDMSKVHAVQEKQGGAGRQDDVIKATRKAKKLIPDKYRAEATSGLKAQVKAEKNVLDFDLPE